MEKLNRLILNNIPVSIITIDKAGYITYANEYYKKISRISDFKNHNIFKGDFFKKENLVKEYKKLLTKGGVFKKDNCHDINNKGEEIYLSLLAAPYRNRKGEIEGVISVAIDNTNAIIFRKKLEELNERMETEIMERTRELNNANSKLNKTLQLKSIFVGDVTHEFRTSLAIMQSSLELLKTCSTLDPELYKNLNSEIKRMSNMLSDLSFLMANDTPKVLNNQKKINLNKIVNSVCLGLKVLAAQKNVSIDFLSTGEKTEIMGTADEIKTLVLNLVRNAVRYNKDGGWIKVWIEKNKKEILLHVEDSGIGIAKNEFKNIFERFYRIDKARTTNPNDSGLGLAICKSIAERHGGRISVKSKLGRGSHFILHLKQIN